MKIMNLYRCRNCLFQTAKLVTKSKLNLPSSSTIHPIRQHGRLPTRPFITFNNAKNKSSSLRTSWKYHSITGMAILSGLLLAMYSQQNPIWAAAS